MPEEALQSIAVTLGDQTFRIRVPEGELEHVQRATALANRVLQDVLEGGVVGGPRAFAMALFQLAVEAEDARQALRETADGRQRLSQLINRLDHAIGPELER